LKGSLSDNLKWCWVQQKVGIYETSQRNITAHNVILANQKTESFLFRWLCTQSCNVWHNLLSRTFRTSFQTFCQYVYYQCILLSCYKLHSVVSNIDIYQCINVLLYSQPSVRTDHGSRIIQHHQPRNPCRYKRFCLRFNTEHSLLSQSQLLKNYTFFFILGTKKDWLVCDRFELWPSFCDLEPRAKFLHATHDLILVTFCVCIYLLPQTLKLPMEHSSYGLAMTHGHFLLY